MGKSDFSALIGKAKEKQIKEFQVLYKKNFGKKISKQKAIVDGMALIRLVYLTQPNYGARK